jgi:hypothetical protein
MKSLIKAVFRIFLVFTFLQIITYLVNYISTALSYRGLEYAETQTTYNPLSNIIAASVVFVIFTLILITLWWKTDRIIKFIAGDISENGIVITTSNSELFRVIMRILGVFLIVTNIAYIVVILGYYFFYLKSNISGGLQTTQIQNIIIHSITVLLGAWLAIGNKAIMNFIDADNIKGETQNDNTELQPPESNDKNE